MSKITNAALVTKVETLEKMVISLEQTLNHTSHIGDVTLREYFDQRIAEQEKVVTATKLEIDRRLEGMNKVHEQLTSFVSKDEYTSFKVDVEKCLIELRQFRDNMQGKASQTALLFTLILSVAALIVSIINLWQ